MFSLVSLMFCPFSFDFIMISIPLSVCGCLNSQDLRAKTALSLVLTVPDRLRL